MYRAEQGYEPVFQEWFPNGELSKLRAAAEDVQKSWIFLLLIIVRAIDEKKIMYYQNLENIACCLLKRTTLCSQTTSIFM